MDSRAKPGNDGGELSLRQLTLLFRRALGMKKAPNAAIAEVKPMIAAASLSDCLTRSAPVRSASSLATSLRMITGKPAGSSLIPMAHWIPSVPNAMATNTPSVMRAPPNRSQGLPDSALAAAATSGPRKA